MRLKIFTVLFCGLVLTFGANAQKPFSVEDVKQKPFAGARENYIDLTRKIFHEAGGTETADPAIFDDSVELRKLADSAQRTVYDAPVKVESAQGWWFRAAGARHLAMLLDVEAGYDGGRDAGFGQMILAVFRLRLRATRGTGSLYGFDFIDAVDPQTDRLTTFFNDLPLIDTSRGNEAFWVLNYHFNAGENFGDYTPVTVGAGNRLEPAIENLPGTYTNFHCADGSEAFFSVERLARRPKNSPPYNFVLTTYSWTEKACEKAGRIIYTSEEKRIYRAARTVKNKRRVWRARVTKIIKRRVRIVPKD